MCTHLTRTRTAKCSSGCRSLLPVVSQFFLSNFSNTDAFISSSTFGLCPPLSIICVHLLRGKLQRSMQLCNIDTQLFGQLSPTCILIGEKGICDVGGLHSGCSAALCGTKRRNARQTGEWLVSMNTFYCIHCVIRIASQTLITSNL